MAKKLNCWEFTKCGREVNGSKVPEFGVCPAALDDSAEGLNGGERGGRICWAVAGTFSDGKPQGTFAREHAFCFLCDFYKMVHAEEGVMKFKVLKPEQERKYTAH